MHLEKQTYKNHTINIHSDEDASDPRDCDNLGTMVCFHNKYTLGDTNNPYNARSYDGWDEMEAAIRKEQDVAVILPLYLFDHSGITMATTPFSCRWDSGQVGFIFVSKKKVREEYSKKAISNKLKEQVTEYLKGEVDSYDKYLRGEYYGYTIDSEDKDDIDSCWGYEDKDNMIEDAKMAIDHIVA